MIMGAFLMYDLLAEDRAARYRAEAEHDRQLALVEASKRRTKKAVAAAASPAATRRALAGAVAGAAALGFLRPLTGWRRRTTAPR
jgi:hypothetical protein